VRCPSLPFGVACWLSRLSGSLSRRLGRGGGTTFPGLVLHRLRPNALAELAQGVRDGVIVLSGTNGKTTTARLVRSALDTCGVKVVANPAGSNLERGVATALLSVRSPDIALFEVDEAALGAVVAKAQPRIVVLMNLSRDQIDRHGELENLAQKWRNMVAGLAPETTLVYNADDPLIAELAVSHPKTVAYGIEDSSVAQEDLLQVADNTACRRCNAALAYHLCTIGHLGHWACPACGFSRVDPEVQVTQVEFCGIGGSRITVSTPNGLIEAKTSLGGLANVYNVAAAVATAVTAGVSSEAISEAVGRRQAAFGRGSAVDVDGKRVTILFNKNPVSANENLRMLIRETVPLQLLILLTDSSQAGQSGVDVSWIYDVDYEALIDTGRVASLTVGGARAHDLALRFQYAGFDPQKISIVRDNAAAFRTALSACDRGGHLFVMPYNSQQMRAIRSVLVDKGLVGEMWEEK